MKWAGLGMGLALAVGLAAHFCGCPAGVYAGSAGGLLLGLVGAWSARRVAARPRAPGAKGDIWTWWVTGLLIRLALAGLLAAAFWWSLGSQTVAALLSMAGVYLVLLIAETGWLYRRLASTRDGMAHG